MANLEFERVSAKRRLARIVLTIALFVSGLLFILDRSVLLDGSFRAATEDVAAPVMATISAPARGWSQWRQSRRKADILALEVQAMRAEIARLRAVEVEAANLRRQLATYSDILGRRSVEGFAGERIAVRAVSERKGPFTHSALIDAGRSAGVETGHAVVSVDGLFGHVTRAGQRSARVLRLSDLNSRIAVMDEKGEGRAILAGDNSGSPQLLYGEPASVWQPGTQVVTSGADGQMPPGIPVGVLRDDGRVRLGETGRADWLWVYKYVSIDAPTVDGQDAAKVSDPQLNVLEGEG